MISKQTIEGCKAGKDESYKELYDATIRYVYTIVSSYIIEPESAKDVIQEIYAGVFMTIKNFDEEKGDFKNWLRGVCVNQCVKEFRNKNKYSIELRIGDVLSVTTHFENPTYNDFTREDLLKLLEDMPKGYRTIFLLFVIDDYSHDEISEMLEISTQTSRSQLHRAKNWIKKNILPLNLNDYGIQRI